ncbi:DUF4178 domain-containing protein [Zavarzinia compransoris]|uniref:DUF4178 domain-containing protein n=1 Tax=Zavarzinia compransoris TaxID=1264899 RepID=UPI0010DE193D|nr:DUF4178 domain-containing protein [Zavarzinia compransoris]TDP47732.1 uncharacterized protein DUF4178 [Zavarzinia compransoris]
MSAPGKPRLFDCPVCGGTVTLRAAGHSLDAACTFCGSLIDVSNENLRVIIEAHDAAMKSPIALGTRGRLHGIDWEVIGYVLKTEGSRTYRWDEYLLFNPWHGFRFLSQSGGHWSLSRLLKRDIKSTRLLDSTLAFEGENYRRLIDGDAIVVAVAGEFYWRVTYQEQVRAIDYVAPPKMLSFELNENEINVSLGDYLEPELVREVFKPKSMPARTTVGANQPSPYKGKAKPMAVIGAIAASVLIMASAVLWLLYPERVAFQQRYVLTPALANQTITTDPFALNGGAVDIEVETPGLNNDWVEVGIALVEENTDDSYSLVEAIEYYQGYDGGEYWSEGATGTWSSLSSIPPGTYRLLIDAEVGSMAPSAAAPRPAAQELHIAVRDSAATYGTLVMALLLLALWPAWTVYRALSFEWRRWRDNAG